MYICVCLASVHICACMSMCLWRLEEGTISPGLGVIGCLMWVLGAERSYLSSPSQQVLKKSQFLLAVLGSNTGLVRQVLYQLSYIPTPIILFFGDRVLFCSSGCF